MNIINVNLSFGDLNYTNNPLEIILHHASWSVCSVEDIHRVHKEENGWAGIGYHYFVRKDGSVYKGRPDNAIGAHTLGHNTNTLGICFEGDYEVETMPVEQITAGGELIAYLKNEYLINNIGKHKDYMSTDCPGKNFPFGDIVIGAIGQASEQSQIEPEQNQVDNWVYRLQGVNGSTQDSIPGPITLSMCPLLRVDSTGEVVKLLQERLKSLGFDCGAIDGYFGNKTKAAVIAYQNANGLVADGIVGPKTWSVLLGL